MQRSDCGAVGLLRRIGTGALLCAAVVAGGAGELRAQTRADTAAVLLDAAEQLRLRGEAGAARALLDLIEQRYGGTPAAMEIDRMRTALRRTPDRERPGRTELLIFGTLYGTWMGVALPLMADSESPEAYGLGLLLGAPVGFFAAKSYADRKLPTQGQARAITFGGTWGTWQGIAWREILDIEDDPELFCPSPGECFETGDGGDAAVVVGSALAGGLLGIGVGAFLARKPITAGTAAATTLAGMWGTWYGFALSVIADQEDDNLLAGTVLGGNAALLAVGLLSPRWQISETRARLISLGGLLGGLGGAGLLLLIQPDDEKVAVAIPTITSAAGLIVAARMTRDWGGSPDAVGGRGALLNRSAGGWTFDTPDAGLRLQRSGGSLRPAAYVPLLNARF